MKTPPRRWLVVLLAVGLVVAAAIALRVRVEWVDVDEPTEPSPEARRDAFFGAKAIVRRVGAHVVAPLNLESLPPPRATLVLLSRHWDLLPGREAGLRRWVEGGGHLVLAETLWFSIEDLPSWMQVAVERTKGRADADPPSAASSPPAGPRSPRPSRLARRVDAPCERRFDEAPGSVPAYEAPRSFRVCTRFDPPALQRREAAVWRVEERGATRMQRVAVGQGHVTANAVWQLFEGNEILRGDHALAWAALLALHPGDEVWFVADEARTPLLVAMWQHGAPAIVLAALALVAALWRRGARFGSLALDPEPTRRSVGEQVRRTAAFIAANGPRALLDAERRALDAAARRHVAGYDALTHDARLDALAAATGHDRARLAEALDPPPRALRRALAELEAARRALQGRARSTARRTTPSSTDPHRTP